MIEVWTEWVDVAIWILAEIDIIDYFANSQKRLILQLWCNTVYRALFCDWDYICETKALKKSIWKIENNFFVTFLPQFFEI